MMKRLEGLTAKTNKLTAMVTSVKFIIGLGLVVLVGTLGLWQYHNMTDPDKVFWGMVDNNLQTSSFTRHNYQKNGSQSVDQIVRIQTSPKQLVNSETVFEQTGVDSAVAVTENIGTPTNDFVRYTSITTAQKGKDGKTLNFNEILNKWGKTEAQDSSQTNGQLYNQSVLGVIPIGSLNVVQRQQLIALMQDKKAYSYKIVQTNRELPFGRPTYVLQVTISPVGYISALKEYAKAEGLNHLEEINPEDYSSSQEMTFSISVDGWTKQVTEVQQSQGSGNENITGRNLKLNLQEAPTSTIPVDELQSKLQQVQ